MEEKFDIKKYVPEFDLELYKINSPKAFKNHLLDYRVLNTSKDNAVVTFGNNIGCFQELRQSIGTTLHQNKDYVLEIIFNSAYVYNPNPEEFTTSLDALYWYIDILKEMGFNCTLNEALLEQNGRVNYVVTFKPLLNDITKSKARIFLNHQALRMIYDVYNIEALHNFYWLQKNYDYKTKGYTLYQLFQGAIMITTSRSFEQKLFDNNSYGAMCSNKSGSFIYSSLSGYPVLHQSNLDNYKTGIRKGCFSLTVMYKDLESFIKTIGNPTDGIIKSSINMFYLNYSEELAEFYKKKDIDKSLELEYVIDLLEENNIRKMVLRDKLIKPVVQEEVVASF